MTIRDLPPETRALPDGAKALYLSALQETDGKNAEKSRAA